VRRIKVAPSRPWPKELGPRVMTRLLGWMAERGVGEVWFEPQGPGLAVRFNACAFPVPGVWLPPEALEDAEALLEVLEEALKIYYQELNLRD